ncbi:MAG: hypothetical protein ACREF1_05435, partial [Acetobacteraceae bacterium]
MGGRGGGGAVDYGLVLAEEGDEVGVPDDLDVPAARASDGGLVEGGEPGASARLAQHPRMQHSREGEVVDEGGAPDLRREVEAGQG